MTSLNAAAIASLATSLLLAIFFASLYQRKREKALRLWSAGWFLLSVYLLASLAARSLPYPAAPLSEWFLAVAALAFYGAARLHTHRPLEWRAIILAAGAAAGWACAYAFGWLPIAISAGAAVIFFATALTFWPVGQKQEQWAEAWLAITFCAWGTLEGITAVLGRASDARAHELVLASLVPMLFAGLLMLMAVYEEDRRRAERDTLGLNRLFTEEQRKSRHLMLINNVSSHAIATRNPVEMLEKIAQEIASTLACDHLGIATLDYSTKELVVQAEAGARKEARGRRIALGEGIVGQVARSGQVAMVREASPSTPEPVLAGTVSSIALPVIYAEQLLGVLYVESSVACDFPEQEILLLRTLADLFAGALHNALTFQKAQEQAITDGLTGVKTHRFLMEALSAEWKRSTRANRPFALVLMDLDRFKFVNDFYGHVEGDVILQRVGHILEQNCRRSDVVARYGGDEFVILMPETSIDQARQLANKLRGWIAADPLLRDKNVTASFGMAGFPMHGSTPQELLQVADSSMYLSKHQGGNSVSSAEQGDPNDRKRWKKDVLEAYLGVTLKRLFSTGPQAFDEIYRRLELFTRSLVDQGAGAAEQVLPPAVVETVTSLAFAIDAKDQYTQGHSQKVSAYSVVLAQALGLDQSDVEEIRLAALLHDIGKVGIPEAILNKSGPLDPTEWETMKSHPELGAKILEPLETMARIRQMVQHHHEFYDGSGYPGRLRGEDIPYGSRVIAIADSYDTITSERSYKKGRSPEEAFAELERCAATQFDPAIVRVFVAKMRQFPDSRPTPKEYTMQSGR